MSQGDIIVGLLGCLTGIAGFMAVALWGLNQTVAELKVMLVNLQDVKDDHEERIRLLERA